MTELDIELLRKHYEYAPETGHLISKRTGRPIKAKREGYLIVKLKGRTYYAHRIAWALHYGEDPADMFVDHIDHDTMNNRIDNLRLLNNADNLANSSTMGIYRFGNKWRAHVRRLGKSVSLGMHDCPLLAGLAVKEYREQILAGCP